MEGAPPPDPGGGSVVSALVYSIRELVVGGAEPLDAHEEDEEVVQARASTSTIMIRFGWTCPEQAMHYQRADADSDAIVRLDACRHDRASPGVDTSGGG